MTIEVLKSKIHRVAVTGAELDYIGSITIIISYASMSVEAAKAFRPTLIFPDTATNTLV